MNKLSIIRDLLAAGVVGGLQVASITLLPWRPNDGWKAAGFPIVLFVTIWLNAWFPAADMAGRHGRAGAFAVGAGAAYFAMATANGFGRWHQITALILVFAGLGLVFLAVRSRGRAVNDPAEGPSATPSFGRGRNGALDAKEQG